MADSLNADTLSNMNQLSNVDRESNAHRIIPDQALAKAEEEGEIPDVVADATFDDAEAGQPENQARDTNPFTNTHENSGSANETNAMRDSLFLDLPGDDLFSDPLEPSSSTIHGNTASHGPDSHEPDAAKHMPIMPPQTPQPRKRGRPRKHPLPEDVPGAHGPPAKRPARNKGLHSSDDVPPKNQFQAPAAGTNAWIAVNQGRGRPPKGHASDFGSPGPTASAATENDEKGKGKDGGGATCTCDAVKQIMKDVFFKHAAKEEGAWVVPKPVALELHRYFGRDSPAPKGALLIPSEKAEALADLLF